jgi:flagellar basal body-associated protein FliL
MEEDSRTSTSLWITIALIATMLAIVLAAVAGFFLGHYTG